MSVFVHGFTLVLCSVCHKGRSDGRKGTPLSFSVEI